MSTCPFCASDPDRVTDADRDDVCDRHASAWWESQERLAYEDGARWRAVGRDGDGYLIWGGEQ